MPSSKDPLLYYLLPKMISSFITTLGKRQHSPWFQTGNLSSFPSHPFYHLHHTTPPIISIPPPSPFHPLHSLHLLHQVKVLADGHWGRTAPVDIQDWSPHVQMKAKIFKGTEIQGGRGTLTKRETQNGGENSQKLESRTKTSMLCRGSVSITATIR